VVRAEWARRLVTGLAELPEDTGTLPPVGPPDPAAYDDAAPAVYVYRQVRDGVAFTGVVGEVAVAAFVDGRARGHEAVQAQRVDSLVRHRETPDVPPALVALLHDAGPAFVRTVDELAATPALLDFPGPRGFRQQVWRVPPGDATQALVVELSAATLYIADGHHRVAAELAAWHRDGEPAGSGVLCVLHPMDGLQLSAFHRRVTGPVDLPALLGLLGETFAVEATASRPAPATGGFGLYAGGRWHVLTPLDAGDGLDIELLQRAVLDRLGQRIEIAPAKTAVDELTRRCDSDEGVLFTLAPPPLTALTRLADAGGVMPPKTTYFEPKPCAGIFRRPTPS
jgi:uncharacterized protein (DUF1015 family)